MTRLRFVAAVNPPTPEFDQIDDKAEVTFLPLEDVWPPPRWAPRRQRPKVDVSSGYTRFREGDVLVPKITPTFEASRSTIARNLPTHVAAGTTELHVVRADRGDARYVNYCFQSKPFLEGGEAAMVGVAGQKRVPETWLLDFEIPIEDLNSQRKIADSLDMKTARIDGLIDRKRRMIRLLAERRRSLIAARLTVGSGARKPCATGNRLAPVIASGWRLLRLKHVLERIVDTEHATAPVIEEGGYLVVRTSNVRNGELILDDAQYTDEANWRRWTRRATPRPGDILLTREAPVGEACLVPESVPLCVGQRVVLLMVDRSMVVGEWLLNSLYAGPAQEFVGLLAYGTTTPHLNMADIPSIPIVVPPLDEQHAELRALQRLLAPLTAVVARLAEQIELLAEHRQALITAAVAGQLDVAEASP